MNNLLLITDVARLRTIFGRLAEDDNFRLRVVNDLEKGGEEIAIEKPDVVFVQTHLSGLSADILLMHLKKQLGRKRARFVLLTSPGQTNDAILKLYHGWLNTSDEDDHLFTEMKELLEILLSKPKIGEELYLEDFTASSDGTQRQLPVSAPNGPDASMEEQGLTYAPRQRLKINSEFSNSFDSAISNAPEPASLEKATSPMSPRWNDERSYTAEAEPARSKKGMFLLWLVPVIIIVVAITYFQQKSPPGPIAAVVKTAPVAGEKHAAAVAPPKSGTAASAKESGSAKEPAARSVSPTAVSEQERVIDKEMLDVLAGKTAAPPPPPAVISIAPELTALPRFIPAYGLDKNYSAKHPGWELYQGSDTEFKVLKEAQKIKAIHVVDRGLLGLTEPFLKRAFGQLAKNPSFSVYTSEKKDGYKIQRGRMADNVKAVYYREGKSGLLRAFTLTWQ